MSGERYDRAGENGAGYFEGANNQYRSAGKVCLAGAVTETASTEGPWVEIGDKGTLRLLLAVSAHTAGGDTLDVGIQTSKDQVTVRSLGSFTQSADVGSELKSFTGCDRYARYVSVLAGSGVSVTYTINGEAV